MPNLEVLVSPQDLIALRSIYSHHKCIEESFHVHIEVNICLCLAVLEISANQYSALIN